jgi:RsiW-degrading membrane proteinase PrsW (M82 family)
MTTTLIISILASLFIAWIWVDYFRLIDIYDKKDILAIACTFILGFSFAYLVFPINDYAMDHICINEGVSTWQDWWYSFIRVGMVEELVKIIPLFIILKIFPKEFNEPIDYIGFASFSALGFSAAENILYFEHFGPFVMVGRSILSTLSHMFDSSIVAYGIIWLIYRKNKQSWLYLILFFIVASASHGFYDFWLISEKFKDWGILVSVLYFMLTVSVFSTMLTNAINNSKFFSYKKIVQSGKVTNRLLAYYGILLLLVVALIAITENVYFALFGAIFFLYKYGFIIVICIIRLSRFKLVENRWEPIRLEFPFQLNSYSPLEGKRYSIRIKGDGFDETLINKYYQETALISPLGRNSSFLGKPTKCFIEKKLFLRNDEVYYVAKVFQSIDSEEFYRFILKPKLRGKTNIQQTYPIVAIMEFDASHDLSNTNLHRKDFQFREWVVLKDFII